MLGSLVLSLAMALTPPTADHETRRTDINAAYEALLAARTAKDHPAGLVAARRLVAAAPDNPVMRSFLARSGARAGDAGAAAEALEWLAARGYGVDARARADLGAFLADPARAGLAGRLAANGAPAGSALSVVKVTGGLRSEGVTYDTRRSRVYLASGEGLFAVGAGGAVSLVAGAEALKDRFVLGVRYDAAGDRVLVCSTRDPEGAGTTAETSSGAELVILHPADPARVERHPLPASDRPRLCNDIAVLADGAAITDTNTGEVFRYRDGAGVTRLTQARFLFPNGVVQVGERIIVADLLGLWAVGADGTLLGQLNTAAGDYLGGIDGLAASGETLIGVQNLTAPGRVVSFRVGDGLVLGERKVLASGLAALEGMSTAAVRGERVVVVAGRPGADGTEERVLVELALN